MKKLLEKIRGYLQGKIFGRLCLPNDNFVVIEESGVYHAEVNRSGYLLGVLPLLEMKKSKNFSWVNFVSKICQDFSEELNRSINSISKILFDSVPLTLEKILLDRVQQTKKKAFTSISQKYAVFHEEFVAEVIKQSTNEFRKELLEKLRISSGEIFTKNVHQHLASILLKMKENFCATKDNSDMATITSGDIALPVGTRFFMQNGNISIYVVEQPPQIRTVTFNWDKQRGEEKKYRLAFPFMVFLITVVNKNFFSLQVFFRKQPLESYMDNLFCPSLPNIYNDFRICFPAPTSSNGNPVKVVEEAIQNFWGSEFNQDLSGFFNIAKNRFPQLSSLEEWEANSKSNPYFVLDLDWQNANMSIIDVINNIIREAKGSSKDQQKDSISTLEKYIVELGKKISQDIQEACFFLIPHLSIDNNGTDIATKKINTILSESCNNLILALNNDTEKTFSNAHSLIEDELRFVIERAKNENEIALKEMEAKLKRIIF